jgi:hypothetical protein
MLDNLGGMLSGALGAVGNVLDAPRRMVYSGLINPAYHALGGDPTRQIGHASDLLAAAGMDKDSWLTKGLGMAGDMATDPLTYAGMAAGGLGAAKAFEGLGPMLGGDAAKLSALAIPEEMAERGGAGMVQQALSSPNASKILNEIPAGSTFQGAGAESLALKTPQGDVLKLSPFSEGSAINYPELPGVNQPTRRMAYGNIEVSRTPMATDVGNQALFDQHSAALHQQFEGAGADLFDFKPEDMGMVNGQPKVLDMGSIDTPNAAGPFKPVVGQTPLGFRGVGMGLGAAAGAAPGVLSQALGRQTY